MFWKRIFIKKKCFCIRSFQTSMNVEVCHVRMEEHVLMTSTAMIAHVSLALLMYIVKQVYYM